MSRPASAQRHHGHLIGAKGGTTTTHPLLGDEMRALRTLKREAKSAFIFVSERGAPFHRPWARHTDRAGRHRAKISFARCMLRMLLVGSSEELRFGTVQAPHAVEWLSDNGSPFTARETLDFAAALGLVPCFTPGKRKRLPRFRARLRELHLVRRCFRTVLIGPASPQATLPAGLYRS